MKKVIAKTLLVLFSASAVTIAGQSGGMSGLGGGINGGFGNGRNGQIIQADQGIRNANNRAKREEEVATEKATQHSINGKCDDEQSAWNFIAPKKTKHKNYEEALALHDKAVAAFTSEKNKRVANTVCEETLTKALALFD